MLTGNCLCGEVKYEIDGKISSIWLCHCSKCRRQTGSAFHASAVCKPDQFRWVSGCDSMTEYEHSLSYKVQFCKKCGSPVPWQLEGRDLVLLHVGGLNEDLERTIDHHIFVGSKAAWFEILDNKTQYAGHRP